MKKIVIIVAGGSGSRMKSDVPKQFMLLDGKPLLMRCIENFYAAFSEIAIIVALPETLIDQWERLCDRHNLTITHQLVPGGETRYHSVKNALALIPEIAVVGIHDAARPLVSPGTIKRVFTEGEIMGAAVPVIPVTDSLRLKKGNENIGVDREGYLIVQTPQCFRAEILLPAYEKKYVPGFTDDASVVEAYGEKISLVDGERRNIKITTSEDLLIAESYLKG